jgi:uncharacterized protein (TIGR02118 family)
MAGLSISGATAMIVSVIYPNHDGAKFDADYYANTHGKLVEEIWAPARTTLVRGTASPGGGAAPFAMIAHFEFADAAALGAAMSNPRTAELTADVPNFTDIQPQLMIGEAA